MGWWRDSRFVSPEPEPSVNRQEFESAYAARSLVTVESLHEHGRYGYPCDCGEDVCEGWQMIDAEGVESEVYLGRLPKNTLYPPAEEQQ